MQQQTLERRLDLLKDEGYGYFRKEIVERLSVKYGYAKSTIYHDFAKEKYSVTAVTPKQLTYSARQALNALADASKREEGIHELGGRFMVQVDGKPRLFVLSKCVNWINEVMTYNAELKENDHAIDATRYAMMNRGQGTADPVGVTG